LSRLRGLDLGLLVVLTPLWLVALVLSASCLSAGRLAWFPLHLALPHGQQEAPIYLGWNPTLEEQQGAEDPPGSRATTLRKGDRLVAVSGAGEGETELVGKGLVDILSAVYLRLDRQRHVQFRIEREGALAVAQATLPAIAHTWRLFAAAAFGLTALFGLARGRGSPEVRAFSLATMSYALHWLIFFPGPPWQVRLGLATFFAGGSLFAPFAVRAAMLFPRRLAVRSLTSRLWPWIFAAIGPGIAVWLFAVPEEASLGLRSVFALNAAFGVALLGRLAFAYRRSDPAERNQLKWVLLGFYLGFAPVALVALLLAVHPRLDGTFLYEHALVATAVIPPCILIAIQRHRLFDINRLITATATYSLLIGTLGTLGLLTIPGLARGLGDATGIPATAFLAVFFAGFMALFAFSARYVNPLVMRFFAPERGLLERGAKTLEANLEGYQQPGPLLEGLGTGLSSMLRLESCVIYGRSAGGFAPVFVHGPVVDHLFPLDGPTATALSSAHDPIDLRTWGRLRAPPWLRGDDRTALDTLRAEVLLPIRHRDALTAFVVLGEKRSGDIFPSSDLSRLDSLADRAGAALARFEPASVLADQRRLRHEIARLDSCFLSYASADEDFARRLYADLDRHGVRCWFAPESLRAGDVWRQKIDEGLAGHDRLLVVISAASLGSRWVGYEVEDALHRERERPGRSAIVFPLRLDDSIRDVEAGWAAALRDSVHIADFRAWRDDDGYRRALDRLLEDLRPPRDAEKVVLQARF